MRTVVFNSLAEQELADAVAYYKEQRLELELEYLEEVEHAVNLLRCYPETGSKIRDSIRRLVLPRFPYSLLYRVLEDGQIRVLAVAHHKRRPQYWLGRE